jgi:threonine/homoserine/homoserine lactone efflux protein
VFHDAHLWLFFIVVFGVVILPGLEMAFVLSCALASGRRAGLMAVAGIMAGSICLVVMTTLGVSVLIRTIPGAFSVLLIGGSLYIAWIGLSILRNQASFGVSLDAAVRSPWVSFRQGVLTNLLNPKAYLFMLAIFPQFLRPEYGALWLQAMLLWLIVAVTLSGVYGSVVLVANQIRNLLLTNPQAGVMLSRVVGVALILAAILTGYDGVRTSV